MANKKSPKIFLYCVPCAAMREGDVLGYALAEDGTGLASHLSSNEYFSQHDMGWTSDWKHEVYQKHYPNGFELEWVNDPDSHERWQKAYTLNQERAKTDE